MPKVKLLRNTGTTWHKEKGVPLLEGGKTFEEGKEYDVSKDVADILHKESLVDVGPTFRGVAPAASIQGVPADDESDVAGMNQPQAIDAISRMRSKDKLQHILNTDTRAGVKAAAEKRVNELV